MNYQEKAIENFKKGYNCAQSVFMAFEDLHGMDAETGMKLSSVFGAGMGKLREVCGAVSGMFMVAGLLYGYDDVTDRDAKISAYHVIQELAAEFEKENQTIICRELLSLRKGEDLPEPAVRTEEYYRVRPCAKMCGDAARILAEYIETHPL